MPACDVIFMAVFFFFGIDIVNVLDFLNKITRSVFEYVINRL